MKSGWNKQLHRNEASARVLADVVDRANAGVIEGRGGTGLALEAFERLRVRRDRVGEELEGHLAPKAQVLGPVDDAHPAAAELLDKAIVRDSPADHWVPRVFCDRSQVAPDQRVHLVLTEPG